MEICFEEDKIINGLMNFCVKRLFKNSLNYNFSEINQNKKNKLKAKSQYVTK